MLHSAVVSTYDGPRLVSKEQFSGSGQLQRSYSLGYKHGLLTSISWDMGCCHSEREVFGYFPSGAVQSHSVELVDTTQYSWRGEEYDEQGRLVGLGRWGGSFGADEQWTYEGNKLLRYEWTSNYRNEYRTYFHDAKGRWTLEYTDDQYMDTPKRFATRRLQYACATDDVLREDSDTDNDGVIDGSRIVRHGEDGRVLEEEFTGVLIRDGIVRVEYEYDCDL